MDWFNTKLYYMDIWYTYTYTYIYIYMYIYIYIWTINLPRSQHDWTFQLPTSSWHLLTSPDAEAWRLRKTNASLEQNQDWALVGHLSDPGWDHGIAGPRLFSCVFNDWSHWLYPMYFFDFGPVLLVSAAMTTHINLPSYSNNANIFKPLD